MTFHFCLTCGSTVYWESEGFPGYIAVAIGKNLPSEFPRANNRGVGGVTPPLVLIAARPFAKADGEAGVIKTTGELHRKRGASHHLN